MRLKTTAAKENATGACQEQLLRLGFEDRTRCLSLVELILGGDKPGEEVYEAWFPRDRYLGDYFIEIYKGAVVVPSSKTNSWVHWNSSNTIKLRFV